MLVQVDDDQPKSCPPKTALRGLSIGEAIMVDPSPTESALEQNAAGPKQVTGDTGSLVQHSLPDQIAADRYLASKAAVRRKGRGIVISKIIPPGAG